MRCDKSCAKPCGDGKSTREDKLQSRSGSGRSFSPAQTRDCAHPRACYDSTHLDLGHRPRPAVRPWQSAQRAHAP